MAEKEKINMRRTASKFLFVLVNVILGLALGFGTSV
jgi:hypothetical protein